MSIALAIALAIALLLELCIEFPMHLLIAFGCLVEAFWFLFHDFLLPFGSLLERFGCLGRAFLDPGTTPGPFGARDANSCEKIIIVLKFGCPRGPQFEAILVILMTF